LEVLSIFKSFSAKTSILDDFAFYDNRQKQLQERREKTKQNRSQRRQRSGIESRADEDGQDGDVLNEPSEAVNESGAQEVSGPSEEESLGEQLAELIVTDRSQAVAQS
jgi:hypothetical protein